MKVGLKEFFSFNYTVIYMGDFPATLITTLQPLSLSEFPLYSILGTLEVEI